MTIAQDEYTKRKNRRKAIRVVFEVLFLLVVVILYINNFVTLKSFTPGAARFAGDRGFVTLAYFGVDRIGSQTLIGVDRLRKHLQAMRDLGYVTISQQDIINYYQAGKDLPEKSLFLIFEDGRRDTAIFAQDILEDLNFKATMMSYPENFTKQDTKFLRPGQLAELEQTTFWEMGTNGYRLAFINVFDRHNNYLGELDPLEHASVAPFLERKYNHYLMDYIRDEYGVPKESHSRMKDRISYDYEALREAYLKRIGYVPKAYVLMHSNTGSFGNNDKVSAVNAHWINNLFAMNFNREGYCWNKRNSSIYDLTRMQPQAYWYTNHLLMRIKYDIHQDLAFVQGDPARHKAWATICGALETVGDKVVITSLPQDRGLVRLKNSNDYRNLKLSVRLTGNKLGLQKIYLRAADDLSRYLAVAIFNNILFIEARNESGVAELFKLNLDQHDGKAPISIPEDKKAAEIRALEIFIKYADNTARAKIYAERLKDKRLEQPLTVAQGAPEYIPAISLHAPGDRHVTLALQDDQLSVVIDGKTAVANLPIDVTNAGSVFLEAAWGEYGWSQRNLADDVYDGVFEQLVITENTGTDNEVVLFTNAWQGLDAIRFRAQQAWETILDWFITHL